MTIAACHEQGHAQPCVHTMCLRECHFPHIMCIQHTHAHSRATVKQAHVWSSCAVAKSLKLRQLESARCDDSGIQAASGWGGTEGRTDDGRDSREL
jgi:hypothetical protein